jgi:hypothetical protein
MDTACFSEMLASTYETTRRQNQMNRQQIYIIIKPLWKAEIFVVTFQRNGNKSFYISSVIASCINKDFFWNFII